MIFFKNSWVDNRTAVNVQCSPWQEADVPLLTVGKSDVEIKNNGVTASRVVLERMISDVVSIGPNE